MVSTEFSNRGCGHLLEPLISAWKATPPGFPWIQQGRVIHYDPTMRETERAELGLREVGMTQRSERHAMAVSNHPIRGLLDLRSISTTAMDRYCTRAGREQASK